MSRFTKSKLNKILFARSGWRGKMKIGSAAFNLFLAASIVSFMVLYLVQINKTAVYGFRARELENTIERLEKENKEMELGLTDSRSISKIEQAAEKLKMVKVGRVEYIKSPGTSMAAR